MQRRSADLDLAVRRFVYETVLQHGVPPQRIEIADATASATEAAAAALERLATARVLVLQPQTREILMAPPFSAVPTPFAVETPRFSCYGNCIWDALGIAAMLQQEVRVRSSCGDCGMAMDVHVHAGEARGEGVLHFAVPARHWWRDIVFS